MKRLLYTTMIYCICIFTIVSFGLFPALQLKAQTLKTVAAAKGKFIGNIMNNDFLNNYNAYSDNQDRLAKTEYNYGRNGKTLKVQKLVAQ